MKKFVIMVLCAGILGGGLVTESWAATEGRVSGTVQDSDGNPLPDAQITFTSLEVQYEKKVTSNKKGKFTAILLDATQDFKVRIERDGYQTIEEPFNPQMGIVVRRTWTMTPGSGSASSADAGSAAPSPSGAEIGGQAGRLYADGIEIYQSGDAEQALEKFQKAADLQPETPEIYSAMALIYLETEQYEAALAAADQVLELKPGDPLALRIQYQVYENQGDTSKQAALLEVLKEFDAGPETARLIFNGGVAQVRAGDFEGAVESFNEAKDMNPELMAAYSALARVYFDLEKYDESIQMAEGFLEKDSSAEVMGVLYLAYGKKGLPDKAEAVFADLKDADPAYVGTVLQELGEAYFNAGQTAEAMAIFQRVLEANPDHPRGNYMLALCYLNAGDTEKAKQFLGHFLELAPNDAEAGTAREMLNTL